MPLTPPPCCILHLDADAFFASVEQRDDPKLRGKPVAVGTGVVASCSDEARRHGVRTGMRLAEARRLCRGLIVLVPAGVEREYLAPWPARVLPGVGPKVEGRLDRLNVQRVGEVAAVPLPVLRGLFGAQGRLLHDQARGIDPRPVEPSRPPQRVSRRTSFDPPVADRAFLGGMLDYLLERALTWLRFHGL